VSQTVQPFAWYGSKARHIDFITSHLPTTHQFVIPFGGSATVLLNRQPSPVEVYNDLNSDLYNFFDVVIHQKDALTEMIDDTPYSRELFQQTVESDPDDAVEQALYFVIRTAMGYNAYSKSWSYSVTTSRSQRAKVVSAWNNYAEKIEQTYQRLVNDRVGDRVQIENKPASDILDRYDRDGTLFYCDPPYPPQCRDDNKYKHEMSDAEHRELASQLRNVDGYVALSTYDCPLIRDEYEGLWFATSEERRLHGDADEQRPRQEMLVMNYDPAMCEEQASVTDY